MQNLPYPDRRTFLKAGAAAAAGALANIRPALAAPGDAPRLRLGIDNFAVRAMGWKAKALIDYAAELECDTLFITDLDAFESLEDAALKEIKAHADDKGIGLLLGTWSICPSSPSFRDNRGTADEHLALGVRAAKALGSPALRVILGSRKDRTTEGGIEARIGDTVAVLKRNKAMCNDAGVKIAVENHAGDMHSTELVKLIEEAGPDWVGANMDSGNAVWTLEDPIENLRNLGKYAITTSLRDTAAWPTEKGAAAQWTAMGEGSVDWKAYFALFAELCPDTAVNIETISGFNAGLDYKFDDYWKAWPNGKPPGFDKFEAFVAKGKPRDPWQPPEGKPRKEAEQDYQKAEISQSIKYCREILGLGRRGR